MKKYILGLLIAFVTFAALTAAPGDAPQAAVDTASQPVAAQAPAQSDAGQTPATGATQTPTTQTPTTGATVPATPSTPSTAKSKDDGGWLGLAIWAAVLGAILAFLWSKGYLVKIRNYFAETQEELKKCSWPSRDELKGSTVVILVTTALLGLFTVGVDWILSNLMRLIT